MNSCFCCGKETTNPKFCSRSCSAKETGKHRSNESREKQRKSICETLQVEYKPKKIRTPNAIQQATKSGTKFTKVEQCTFCKKWFNYTSWKHTTCSYDCHMKVKMVMNAGLHHQVYKGVMMDSSWEVKVAILLDELNIAWYRPSQPLHWTDSKNKSRKYFPDFYLKDFNLYLDPKNPIAFAKQQEKINYFKTKNVIFGSLSEILAQVRGLKPPCIH